MSDLDTNIDNWSIDDLLDLFGLTEDNQTTQSIEEVSGQLIESSNDSGNDTIAEFIKQARDKLMENLSKETEVPFLRRTSYTTTVRMAQ